jgi:hypothetical protein
MKTLCQRIETHFRVFSNRYYPIVVIFDRENRPQTPRELLDEINAILADKKLDPAQFIFLISDRDIEVMFVCHHTKDGEFIDTGCPETTNVDGVAGESELRNRLSKRGIAYHKTTVGMTIFKKIRPLIVASKSENFRRFRDQIVTMCKWATM